MPNRFTGGGNGPLRSIRNLNLTSGDGMWERPKVTQPMGGLPGRWGPQPDIGYIGGLATATRYLANANGQPPKQTGGGISKQKAIMSRWSGRTRNEAPKASE